MKTAWLICGVIATIGPCSAKPGLHRVELTLRYEMKSSLHSLPSSPQRVQTQNHFMLSVSDSFYAVIDPTRETSFKPLGARPRGWQGEFQVSGHTDITDQKERFKCDVKGGRALKKSEMPSFALRRAPMGAGQNLAFQFDFPVDLKVQSVISGPNGNTTSTEALPGTIPLCLERSADATVFRQTIEANPPLSRRPQDDFGARTYDGWQELQKRGEFWLSSPTFFKLKSAAPNLYILNQTRAFPFKPSKTETQNWTQSLSLKLAISPA